jgi:hypothetical protein
MTTNSGQGPPPKVVTTARGYTRTLHARLVQFRCEWCSEEREVWQYPGPVPRYCCEECRREAQRALNAGRQREKRERDAPPWWGRRNRVGRPRKLW